MSGQVEKFSGQLERIFDRTPATTDGYSKRSPMGKAIAAQDQRTELAARQDYNEAKLVMHRDNLEQVIEKQRNQQRAELVQEAMYHAKDVNDIVGHLSNGMPNLEMTLRELQGAYNQGEVLRVFKRGAGL